MRTLPWISIRVLIMGS